MAVGDFNGDGQEGENRLWLASLRRPSLVSALMVLVSCTDYVTGVPRGEKALGYVSHKTKSHSHT